MGTAQVSFILSQFKRLTDRQTDRQNCYSNPVRWITRSRTVKTPGQKLKAASMNQVCALRPIEFLPSLYDIRRYFNKKQAQTDSGRSL